MRYLKLPEAVSSLSIAQDAMSDPPSSRQASTKPQPSYKYCALSSASSIRAIELQPGTDNELLICSVHEIDLDSNPDFRALSYVLGAKGGENYISVQSNGGGLARLAITANLRDALLQIRRVATTTEIPGSCIWIDAICIDQENGGEREHQVAMMRRIYARARQVLLWLGKADEGTAGAVEYARAVGRHIPVVKQQELKTSNNLGDIRRLLEASNLPVFPDEWIRGAQRLFAERAWFESVWVIQEVSAGSLVDVYVGKFSLTWDEVGLMAMWLREAERSEKASAEGSEHLRNAVQMWLGRFNSNDRVPDLLDDGRDFRATDARAKIYAMLGFPSMMRDAPLTPRYGSLKALEVYTKLVLTYIAHARKLDILSYVEHPVMGNIHLPRGTSPVRRWPDFPSWVPDWSESTYFPTSAFSSMSCYRTRDQCAHGRQPHRSDQGGSTVHGSELGRVAATAKSLVWSEKDGQPWLTNPEAVLDLWISRQLLAFSASEASARTSFAHALTAGINASYEKVSSDDRQHLSGMAAFLAASCDSWVTEAEEQYRTCLRELTSPFEELKTEQNYFSFLQAAYLMCPSRQLFHDELGLAGLGHSQVRSGDVIVQLDGSVVPFILRAAGDRFELVGECFLYLETPRTSTGKPSTTFELC